MTASGERSQPHSAAIDQALNGIARGLLRRATAYHEAAHAVASALLRTDPRRATIASDGASLGHFQGGPPFRRPPDDPTVTPLTARQRRRIEREIVVSLAGVHGELCSGIEDADLVARAQGDADRVAVYLRLLDLGPDEEEAFLRRADEDAERLVAEHEAEIAAVAGVLLEQETLSGHAVREIIRSLPKR